MQSNENMQLGLRKIKIMYAVRYNINIILEKNKLSCLKKILIFKKLIYVYVTKYTQCIVIFKYIKCMKKVGGIFLNILNYLFRRRF